MFRYLFLFLLSFIISAGPALAQTQPPASTAPGGDTQGDTPSAPVAPGPKFPPPRLNYPVIDMTEPVAGDHWSYETHDEITGETKRSFTHTVTDTAGTEISIRVEVYGKVLGGSTIMQTVYLTSDHAWNIIKNTPWQFSPNDGLGVKLPLTIGQSWSFQSNVVNSLNGATFKRSGQSKVVAEEGIATRVGTFNTFKIETTYSSKTSRGSIQDQVTQTTWYAPAIDHWVKRTTVTKSDGQTRENDTDNLIAYGRRRGPAGDSARPQQKL